MSTFTRRWEGAREGEEVRVLGGGGAGRGAGSQSPRQGSPGQEEGGFPQLVSVYSGDVRGGGGLLRLGVGRVRGKESRRGCRLAHALNEDA